MTVASRKLNRSKFQQIWAALQQQTFEATWEARELTLLRYEQQRWQQDDSFPLQKL